MAKKPPAKLGRPSGYRPEFADQMTEYFSVSPYSEVLKKVVTKSGDVVEVPTEVAADFPTLAGFAIKIGVHRDTLHEWSKIYPAFSDAYKMAKEYQENFIVVNGLRELIHPAFGIFTAKNVLGWRDKQPGEEDKTVTHKGEVTVNKPDLEDRVKQIKGES